MNKKELEKTIREWANVMVNQYKWLTIRFEYSDSYRCFLVSFYYSKSIDDDNEFYKEVLDFEKKMADNCSDDTPLFCDEEKLFKLSDNAETIGSCISLIDSYLEEFYIANNIIYDKLLEREYTSVQIDEFFQSSKKFGIAA